MGNRKKKKSGNPKRLVVWLMLLVLFIAELFLYTWCRVQCIRTGYEISRQNHQHLRLTLLQKNLKIELARLKSPERIVKIAETELGLVMPNATQTIVVP